MEEEITECCKIEKAISTPESLWAAIILRWESILNK